MRRIAFWCHYPADSRSAAGQRMNAFAAALVRAGMEIVRLGGWFGASQPKLMRLLHEARVTVFARARILIVSVPPYRSVLPQLLLLIFLPWRKLIVDQRDLVLEHASAFEKLVERRLVARAKALVVTTHAQRRALLRHGKLPSVTLIRNGASDDLADIPRRERTGIVADERLRAVYQGLVSGKRLSDVVMPLCALGCDLDLVVFLDRYSAPEIDHIRGKWSGPGTLSIYSDLDAAALAAVMDRADFALNPIPRDMDYAFTVKTADYACRGIPQLVIGGRRSVSRRIVERCKLGHAIENLDELDAAALDLVLQRHQPRNDAQLRIFRRSYHADRIVQIVEQLA